MPHPSFFPSDHHQQTRHEREPVLSEGVNVVEGPVIRPVNGSATRGFHYNSSHHHRRRYVNSTRDQNRDRNTEESKEEFNQTSDQIQRTQRRDNNERRRRDNNDRRPQRKEPEVTNAVKADGQQEEGQESSSKQVDNKSVMKPNRDLINKTSRRFYNNNNNNNNNNINNNNYRRGRTVPNNKRDSQTKKKVDVTPDTKRKKSVESEEEEESKECPLCLEALDEVESILYPCHFCKFQICLFCLNRLKEDAASSQTDSSVASFGSCPGCRNSYPSDEEWKLVAAKVKSQTKDKQKTEKEQRSNRNHPGNRHNLRQQQQSSSGDKKTSKVSLSRNQRDSEASSQSETKPLRSNTRMKTTTDSNPNDRSQRPDYRRRDQREPVRRRSREDGENGRQSNDEAGFNQRKRTHYHFKHHERRDLPIKSSHTTKNVNSGHDHHVTSVVDKNEGDDDEIPHILKDGSLLKPLLEEEPETRPEQQEPLKEEHHESEDREGHQLQLVSLLSQLGLNPSSIRFQRQQED